MTVNAPARFQGTDEERRRNQLSHDFYEGRCTACDCRPWGRVAEWPCGTEPPRVESPLAAVEFDRGFQAYAALGGVA